MSKGSDTKTSNTLLGTGVYDLGEAARLVRRGPETIARWTRGNRLVHDVSDPLLFCFLDVISLFVISELRSRQVPLREIRSGGKYLADKLHTDYPFAHRQLATAGGAFFGSLGDWYDVGKHGQGAFQSVIEDLLMPIEYGMDHLADRWRPSPGVLIDPSIQAGAPCIEGTRVPTLLVADLVKVGEAREDIAGDYALNQTQIEAALTYELAA